MRRVTTIAAGVLVGTLAADVVAGVLIRRRDRRLAAALAAGLTSTRRILAGGHP